MIKIGARTETSVATGDTGSLIKWSVFVACQAIGAAIFVWDVGAELLNRGLDTHTSLEGIATIAVLLGLCFATYELWRATHHVSRTEHELERARASFSQQIEDQFALWQLSPAEKDTALLILKGMENDEIATLRGVAAGTVRAQLASIYRKSDTHGRGAFVSQFLDHWVGFSHLDGHSSKT